MKLLIGICIVLLGLSAEAQIIKEKIGKSVWLHKGEVVCDTTISFVQKFDNTGRKIMEWQIYKDRSGTTTDSNWVKLDTLGRQLEFRGYSHYMYYTYTDYILPTKTLMVERKNPRDTMIFESKFELDSAGNIASEYQYVNGRESVHYTYIYSDNVRSSFIYHKMVTKEVTNPMGEWILLENYDINSGKLTNRYIRIFDINGNNHYYAKIIDGILQKETTHEFDKTGKDIAMRELFPLDSIQIITTFEYINWE